MNVSCSRILLVFPGPELGGAERQGMHLARYLKRMGCEVHIWSTLPGEGRVVEECSAEGFSWAAHRFLWPCRKSSLVRDGWRLVRALRKLRPDVILSYTFSPNVGCGLFWRFTPAKICVWGQRDINPMRGNRIARLAYRNISAVVCNAFHEVEYLNNSLGESYAPVHVIHNGLDLAPAVKSRLEWRKELKIPENASVVIMLANFRQEKDHATLLHAWNRILQDRKLEPHPCLVLAGAPQFTFAAVKRLVEDLHIKDTVRFPGQVHDVPGLLAACDIGVLTSKREGMSNTVLEYMASGLPVIATDLPGNREALGNDAGNQVCKIMDPVDLAKKIQTMIRDESIRKQTGRLNKDRADECFSIQSMCHKTIAVISDLSQGKK